MGGAGFRDFLDPCEKVIFKHNASGASSPRRLNFFLCGTCADILAVQVSHTDSCTV